MTLDVDIINTRSTIQLEEEFEQNKEIVDTCSFLKKCQEKFNLNPRINRMASAGNRRYLQYILLLGEGSSIVLKGLLMREVRTNETTLENHLISNRCLLVKQLRDSKHIERIFPTENTINTDIDTWDILLLAKVLLNLKPSFLTWNEKAAIRVIRDMRNELLAHTPLMSFETEEFDTHWSHLCETLTQLKATLENMIQEKCDNVITRLENGIENINDVSDDISQCRNCDERLTELVDKVVDKIKAEVVLPLSDKIDENHKNTLAKFDQNTKEIKAEIKSTREATQEVVGQHASDIHGHIDQSTGKLASELYAVAGTSAERLDKIEENASKTNVQLDNISNETRGLQRRGEYITEKVEDLSDKVTEGATAMKEMDKTLKMICEQIEHLQNQGKDFRCPQEIDIELDIEGGSEEMTSQADDELIEAFKHAMTKVKRARLAGDTERNTELDKLVQQFSDKIEQIDDIEIQDIKKACILLTLTCASLEGLLACVNYMMSDECLVLIQEISRVLSNQFDHDLKLNAHVVTDSVMKAFDSLERVEPVRRSLRLPVRVHTMSGLHRLCDKFRQGELQETLQDISNCLTTTARGQVTVHGHLNIPQIQKVLDKVAESKEKKVPLRLDDRQPHRRAGTSAAVNYRERQTNIGATGATGYTSVRTVSHRKSVYKIKSIRSVYIRINKDRAMCGVYRICQLRDNSILIADYNNQRLKRLNSSYKITDFCDLPGKPWGVCYLGNNEAVVALNNNSLLFVDVRERMSIIKSVRFAHPCWSLSCHGGRIFIKGGESVYSYNTSGDDKRKLYTEPSEDAAYQNIKVSDDGQRIYVANDQNGFTSIDMDGHVVGRYEDNTIERVDDICTDREGSLFICDKSTGIISQIDENSLEKIGDLSDGSDIREPWVLYYNRLQQSLIVGHSRKDSLTIVELYVL